MNRARLWTLAPIAALLGGCGSDYWVDFKYISDADARVLMTRDRIEIPVGFAVGVEAYPVEDGERQTVDLEMSPARPNIVGVDRGLEEQQWVFYGESVGSTQLELYFDGELVGEMPAVVVDAE
jgi:hypothetical protein